jgi:PKD repeat protein
MLLFSGLFATQNEKMLKLRLQSPTGNISDAAIYFDQNINPSYDINEDAEMVFNNLEAFPELYSMTTDKVPCSINGAGDLSTTAVVALGYHVGFPGTYNLSATLLDDFDATSVIQLEDRQLGIIVDLRENFYQVQLDSNGFNDDRFFIHVSTPVQFSSTPSNCSNNGGEIFVTPDTTIHWNLCQLYNADNVAVATEDSISGPFTFSSLPAGNYKVIFTYNQYTTTHNFQLAGNFVVASIASPSNSIYTDESVVFNALTTNASEYTWNFGDGSLVTGVADAPQTYFTPGNYTVVLTCTNQFGCSATAQTSVAVNLTSSVNAVSDNEVNIYSYNNMLQVNMNGTLSGNAELTVYNLLGQPVLNRTFESQKETFDLSRQASGYYFATVKNAGKSSTKRIFISQ